MKTSELTGAALDWAVGATGEYGCGFFSTDWAQAGAIIEREKITVEYRDTFDWWVAYINGGTDDEYGCTGDTPLIAAMRCYVASKLGDEVKIPEELINE